MEDAIKIILAIIGSNGLFALIQFFINRRDVKKGEKAEIRKALTRIEKRLDNNERDTCRTQLLLLIADYPQEQAEIMKLGEHYFKELKGNWYMTGLFNTWLATNNLGKPEWFSHSEN